MPMGFRMLPPAAALVAVLVLAGCVPTEPPVTPEPDPQVTPVFASDEEALAAATEAYEKYLEVSDQIAADGGTSPERMNPLVTEDQYQRELEGFTDLVNSKRRIVGISAYDSAAIQSWSMLDAKSAQVVIYACSDASSTRVLDDTGADVTPVDRQVRAPFELEFVSSSEDASSLVLARSDLWSGTNFC